MSSEELKQKLAEQRKNWQKIVAKYQKSSIAGSVWQLVNSIVPYFVLWYLMYQSLKVSYWLTLGLAVLAAGFVVRIFIIFHDCGHGAFFKSRKANDIVGLITGILTFTPYNYWRWEHARHHASAGDLDNRGVGDIWTMTVKEYLDAPRWKKFIYRCARNPIFLFFIGPSFLFLIRHRFPLGQISKHSNQSILTTNLALLFIVTFFSLTIGLKAYLAVQLPVIIIAASMGVWLFYVQHQYEGVYWERHQNWDYVDEALKGSSFFKLPKVLQWFSGNIGFHHIHHLSPLIPNYRLQQCYKENELFQNVKPITFLESFKSASYKLWDEDNKRLINFKELKTLKV